MPDFNLDDIDFDLNNLRQEEDLRRRRGSYEDERSQDTFAQQRGIPIDGNKIMGTTPSGEGKSDKATKTVLDLYDEIGHGDGPWKDSK